MTAVLAVAEMQPVTGAEALAAFMLGIEAVCRLSKAISVAPAYGDIAWSQAASHAALVRLWRQLA
jgi:2-methylcitrate dehydratase PrpD